MKMLPLYRQWRSADEIEVEDWEDTLVGEIDAHALPAPTIERQYRYSSCYIPPDFSGRIEAVLMQVWVPALYMVYETTGEVALARERERCAYSDVLIVLAYDRQQALDAMKARNAGIVTVGRAKGGFDFVDAARPAAAAAIEMFRTASRYFEATETGLDDEPELLHAAREFWDRLKEAA